MPDISTNEVEVPIEPYIALPLFAMILVAWLATLTPADAVKSSTKAINGFSAANLAASSQRSLFPLTVPPGVSIFSMPPEMPGSCRA